MPDLSEFETAAAVNARAPKPSHPTGFEPGISWDGKQGTVTSRPLAEPDPDWTAILEAWNFDPALFEVVEPVQVRTWDAAIGDGQVRTMWYYRAGLRRKRADSATDVQALIDEVRRHRSTKRPVPQDVERSFVIGFADPQIGKLGTVEATQRVLRCLDRTVERIRDLRRIGRPCDAIYLLGLGDIIEQCDGHYAMQAFQTELNRREQVTLARRLITKYVTTLAPLAPRMVVAAVGGNHGENRRDGKSYTDFSDNDDVAIFEQVAEVIGANPAAYGHVSFSLPKEQLTLTLDISGTLVTLAHGHQARRSGMPQQKVREWWKDQMYGGRAPGDAALLLTGHYHHLSIIEDGPRTHMQAPTLDSGSQWFEETAGKPSRPGLLTFTIGPDGWDDVAVLR